MLAFDEFDRQCANHFLARKVALKGRQESHRLLEQTQRQEDAIVLRIIAEGWSVLAEAQSALAHSCIVMLNVRSAKLNFLFDCQKQQAVALQQKFEETWTSLDTFCVPEAKAAIRDLRLRLKDYLLIAHAEIVVEHSKPKRNKVKASTPVAGRSPARGSSSSASPARRSSATQVSGQKTEGTDAPADPSVSAADQPMVEWLQQHCFDQGLLALPGFLTEVASTVFGDALGGSWRTYCPAAAATPSHHHNAKAETFHPQSSTALEASAVRSPIGSIPLPVRAFGGIQAISFSSSAQSSRSLLSASLNMSPPPVSELRLPRSERAPLRLDEEEEEEEERGESQREEDSSKRPRK